MSLTNCFTKKPVPSIFKNLHYKNTVASIDSTELPYFSIKLFRKLKDGPPFDPFSPDRNEDFAPLTEQKGWAMLDDVAMLDENVRHELRFLNSLSLVLEQNNPKKIYIHPFAAVFYCDNGIFETFSTDYTAEEKTQILRPLMKIFLQYTLPGRYWRAFYGRIGLPKDIYNSAALQQEMLETEKEWTSLKQLF